MTAAKSKRRSVKAKDILCDKIFEGAGITVYRTIPVRRKGGKKK